MKYNLVKFTSRITLRFATDAVYSSFSWKKQNQFACDEGRLLAVPLNHELLPNNFLRFSLSRFSAESYSVIIRTRHFMTVREDKKLY
jgi:hypothetical protein